ncbi:hypothetical protein N8Z61_02815 [Candidatus Thioglobus sp.]|nr:hypothetical protein [Candidatus Thioglobus sp.]
MVPTNIIKNVLITGASGSLGRLIREIYWDKNLTLISRSKLVLKKNEVWLEAQDLVNSQWWSEFRFDGEYDLIIHFAEPVKKSLSIDYVNKIVESHTEFITNASKSGALIIYPLSAYSYDSKISKSQLGYFQIKTKVSEKNKSNKNVIFPIIHPLVDYGSGLNKLISIEKKIPLVNIFCSFNAQLPILKKEDLELFFININQVDLNQKDVYSDIRSISKIFYSKERFNFKFLSIIFKIICLTFSYSSQIKMLVKGRKII